jgi:hypothetical protein
MSRVLGAIAKLLSGGALRPGPALLAMAAVAASAVVLVWASAKTETSGNPASRLAAIEALVDHGDWSINDSVFRYQTVDKVRIEGRFYSSKPPVYPLVGAVAYSALERFGGPSFAEDERTPLFWLRLWLHVLPFLVGVLVAGRFLRGRIGSDWVWALGLATFALGTFVFGYSATINNHAPAALLLLAAWTGAYRLRQGSGEARWWSWLGVGFCAALAVALDFGAGAFAVGLALYLTLSPARRGMGWFLLGAAVPILIHFHLTHRLMGSFAPAYLRPELYHYPGSYWLNPGDFDALSESRWRYALQALVGHHGLFSMTPIFLLAIPGTIAMWRRPARRADALLIAAVTTATVLVYLVRGPHNYGGTASGMRWFIVLVPPLWLAAVELLDRRGGKRWRTMAFVLLAAIGAVHALQAVWWGPWRVSPWNLWLRDLGLGSVAPG